MSDGSYNKTRGLVFCVLLLAALIALRTVLNYLLEFEIRGLDVKVSASRAECYELEEQL